MEWKTAYFKGLTKKDYISKTRELIEEEGVEAVSIRRIAREMGCSSASLYRHFENLTELLYFAEIHKLSGYINRLNEAQKNWTNIWEYYVGIWDCFSREAFRNTQEYNLLFFEFDNTKLNNSFKEYYEMFPEEVANTNKFFSIMLETNSFMERDFEICKKCIGEGVIDYEGAIRLNRMACLLCEGYFKEIAGKENPTEEEIDRQVDLYIKDLDWIVKNLAKDLGDYKGYVKK